MVTVVLQAVQVAMRAYSRVVMFAMMVRVHVGLVSKLLTVMVMMLAYALTEALVFFGSC